MCLIESIVIIVAQIEAIFVSRRFSLLEGGQEVGKERCGLQRRIVLTSTAQGDKDCNDDHFLVTISPLRVYTYTLK